MRRALLLKHALAHRDELALLEQDGWRVRRVY